MSQMLVELVVATFPRAVVETHSQFGDDTVVVAPASWKQVASFLLSDPRCDMKMLIDLTAVDFPDRDPRFEVVAHFYSIKRGHRLRLKARIGHRDGKALEIDTLSDLWPSAAGLERECVDMFGVTFLGHPDRRRILLHPEVDGRSLRKDSVAEEMEPSAEDRDVSHVNRIASFGLDAGLTFGGKTYQRRNRDHSRMN